jgi:diadenylate cyclase
MESFSVYKSVFVALFTWRAALDLLLIAALLYFLYITFIRLGTWKILLGIFTAMVFLVVAEFLDLTGVKWIYSNLSHVAVIGLIVIFQPELRKVFERAMSLRRNEIGESGSRLPEMISEAVFDLSMQKRGAIIVFPGKEPIEEWQKGGYNLNADPSFPLIMSIFDPHSPGHDGSLIIMNGKLVRYGVRLPISQSNRLPGHLGTRHHAALGLSEVSDALVLVVSEERGTINLFYQGKVSPISTREEVVSAILSHWRNTASYLLDPSKIRKKRISVPQLIASLAVSAFFWSTLHIAGIEIIEKVLTVPVEYIATPHDIVLVGEKPSEVKLHLAGPKPDLDSLVPSQSIVKIDLSKAKAGKQTFIITQEDVKLPKRVQLLDVDPSTLNLTLVGIVEQAVPIRPQLVGELPDGIILKSINVTPTEIRVLSPSPAGQKSAAVVTTTPIYLESIKQTTTILCKIIAAPSLRPVEQRWPDVQVVIKVGPKS